MSGRIVNEGCGGFLNPPGHPEHSFSVQSKDFILSLSTAVDEEYVSENVRNRAAEMLNDWKNNMPDLKSKEVQDWIYQILGYFRNCYKGEGDDETSWHVANLRGLPGFPPTLNIDLHAGVHHIRKFYPEFRPLKKHFKNAYWGNKA